jgi:hypothetical protein
VRKSLVYGLSWVLVFVFPASIVMADATSAMLNSTGNVTVNGAPVDRATAVFPGDQVQTGANSLATLTSAGSSVVLPGNSRMVFSRSLVNVLCGTAVITTQRGLGVKVGKVVVQPARGVESRFQVTQNEGELQIIAKEGTLAVDNGSTTTSLMAGRMLTAPAACVSAPPDSQASQDQNSPTQQTQNQDQDQDKNKKRKGGVYARTAPPAGGTNTGMYLLAAAAAGGLAGFLVWLTTRGGASPTTP